MNRAIDTLEVPLIEGLREDNQAKDRLEDSMMIFFCRKFSYFVMNDF